MKSSDKKHGSAAGKPGKSKTKSANSVGSVEQAGVTGQIIGGARRLFFSTGFRSVTMDELARHLAMSKKTLYQHFQSKDELVRAVLALKFSEVDATLSSVLEETAPMPVQLAHLLAGMQTQVQEIQPAFVRDVQRSDPELFRHIDAKRQELIRKYFGALLEKGQREGAVRTDVPVNILLEILLAGATGLVNPPRLMQLNLAPQQAFHYVISVFLQGILEPIKD